MGVLPVRGCTAASRSCGTRFRSNYLSLEFLIGRSMQNALLNMDLEANYKKVGVCFPCCITSRSGVRVGWCHGCELS